jgi:glutaredoxin
MPNCPDCKNAKELLARKGLHILEITDFTPAQLIARVGPIRTLPQIVKVDIEGDEAVEYHVGGYKDLTDHLLTGAKVLRKLG